MEDPTSHSNELSGSTIYEGFVDYLINCKLLKESSPYGQSINYLLI